jgi:flagellin
LSAQAVSDTYRGRGRSAINLEINQLLASIDQMALGSQFNGIRPLTGTVANMFIQVGPNNDPTNDRINIISAFGDTTTNVATGLNLPAAAIFNSDDALVYIGRADSALNIVNTRRSTLGAMQNRLESAAANLMNSVENLAASESRIRNVDVASESAEMMRFQILQQASASILSQANQMPSLALKLLGN